jgi:hypothetical protein
MRRGGSSYRIFLFLAALAFLIGACESPAATTEPSSAPAESTTTTSLATTTTTTLATTSPPTQPTTTTQPVDAPSVVGQSVAATSGNYRFSSVVLVGEQALTTINGIVDAGSVAADIVTGEGAVSYVRTAAGEWVTGPDGAWVPMEGELAPVTPPLSALSDATDLRLESGTGTDGVFTGILGPAAGPAQGIPFTLTTGAGLVSEIRYQVESSAGPAQVTTTFTEVGVAGAVIPPPGA